MLAIAISTEKDADTKKNLETKIKFKNKNDCQNRTKHNYL